MATVGADGELTLGRDETLEHVRAHLGPGALKAGFVPHGVTKYEDRKLEESFRRRCSTAQAWTFCRASYASLSTRVKVRVPQQGQALGASPLGFTWPFRAPFVYKVGRGGTCGVCAYLSQLPRQL